jgi:nucleotide-binding universal stress UspA family protein
MSRASPCPIIAMKTRRNRRRLAVKTILIATDGSPSSQEASEFGVALAAEHDAEVVFVHVVPDFDPQPMNGFGMVGVRPHEISEADTRILAEALEIAEQHGVPATTKLLRGDTVDEIVAYADNLDADLTVVGSRGHGALASVLLGSVSRGVLSESKRAVTVIRGRADLELLVGTH